MAKFIDWVYNKDTQRLKPQKKSNAPKEIAPEQHFEFDLKRYKDENTGLENLLITCYLLDPEKPKSEEKFNGSMYTDVFSLDKKLKEFMKYGVVLSLNEFSTIEEAIRNCYLSLKTVDVTVEEADGKKLNKLITDILNEYKEHPQYISGDEQCIYVPVEEFNSILSDRQELNEILNDDDSQPAEVYYNVDIIKAWLRNNDKIERQVNRSTKLARLKGTTKTIRVIAFPFSKWPDVSRPIKKETPKKPAAVEGSSNGK